MPYKPLPRSKLVPILVLVLGLAAIAAITLLIDRSDASRVAELTLAEIKGDLNELQNEPFRASPTTGGSPEVAAEQMRTAKLRIGRDTRRAERQCSAGSARRHRATL